VDILDEDLFVVPIYGLPFRLLRHCIPPVFVGDSPARASYFKYFVMVYDRIQLESGI
jgi:hypothetical protein